MTVLNIVAKQWEDTILVKLLGFDGIKIMIPDPFYLKTVFIMNLILNYNVLEMKKNIDEEID